MYLIHRPPYKILPLCLQILAGFCISEIAVAQLITPFERDQNSTTTYQECIQFYENLSSTHAHIKVIPAGPSDVSFPIHTVVIAKNNAFTPEACQKQNKLVLLINNGIHPGEPDGIDASMIFARDLLSKPEYTKWLDKITFVIIPIYNIGGSLQRNSHTRLNQNGPKEFGFRGNAQNLDLNRDFIKCDSKNASTFNLLFNAWRPHLFIDTHTTDGADYPYVMTLISNELSKLEKPLRDFYGLTFLPQLYAAMKQSGNEMFPYVDSESTPDNGIFSFIDYPRYSSGYGHLFSTFCVMTETHMLKPHAKRVAAQRIFFEQFATLAFLMHEQILAAKSEAVQSKLNQREWTLVWHVNKHICDSIFYNGYAVDTLPSHLGSYQRIQYNTSKPISKNIAYYNCFEKNLTVVRPKSYIIPYCYEHVIQRLQWNNITMHSLEKDTMLSVGYYTIEDYQTSKHVYENHYKHDEVNVLYHRGIKKFLKGDFVVSTNQPGISYLIQTLEPHAPDSFFAWNFFDGILSQKEYFSDYIFEDLAEEWLTTNPELKKEFELEKAKDPHFESSKEKILHFIYTRQGIKEPYYLNYPVARIEYD